MSSEAIIGITFGLSATMISIVAILVSMQRQNDRTALSKFFKILESSFFEVVTVM